MANIGELNTLIVLKTLDFGVYLDGGNLGEILLPIKQVPQNCQIGDKLEVFLYHDTEHRLIATTYRPLAAVGEFGYLKVATVNEIGAFLEWGIPKELFVPFREQFQRMKEGYYYLVYVYLDEASQRIVGSSKLKKFLSKEPLDLEVGQEVDLIIAERTDAGYKAIINNSAMGLLYHSDLFQIISEGQRIKGFIKSAREDGKFDLVLQKPGYEKVPDVAEQILDILKSNGGVLAVSDKSPADQIMKLFGISKKTFKKAIGALFKARQISIEEKSIRLLSPEKIPHINTR